MHDIGVMSSWPQYAMHAMMSVKCLASINVHENGAVPSWHQVSV